MQKILGKMRKAIHQYDLISEGDKIAVGISGGKDSLILLKGLALLRKFIGINFDIIGITLDPLFNNAPLPVEGIKALCEELNVEYVVVPYPVYRIVFEERKEKHPCALCAKLRRGILHSTAKEHGCNKIALGHNFDDTVETFLMNLFNEARIDCYSPKIYLDRRDITLIRPLVFCEEREIRSVAKKLALPVVKSPCPVDGKTNRETTKSFITQMNRSNHGFSQRIFTAVSKTWK
jgi:tRNA(Ile)-lysidine synthase TilS/MesJ